MKRRDRYRIVEWMRNVKTFYGCWECKVKTLCLLTFHHLDKKKKNHSLCGAKSNYSKAALASEFSRCTILCLNCHKLAEENLIHVGKESKCQFNSRYEPIAWETDEEIRD